MKPANILKIETLSEDWADKDIVMLHCNFQLLTDCIESEKLRESTDWNQSDGLKQAKKEIDELYEWWKNRVKAEKNNQVDPIWTETQYEKDTEMLVRLIKIREYLWI